jgi:hypothetical protein
MAAKHKIRIYSIGFPIRRLWYVSCQGCAWEPNTSYRHADGIVRYGRPNLDTALALGVAHQKEEQDAARLAK